MRKVTLGLANSLDNYIARKDGGFDWLHWSKEVAEISAKFMKTVDALLIGPEDVRGDARLWSDFLSRRDELRLYSRDEEGRGAEKETG